MARSTYHHLVVNDRIVIEKVRWDGRDENLTVHEQYTHAKVVKVTPKLVEVTTDWKGTTAVFSRRSGMEWGSEIEWGCWRIAPAFGRVKSSTPEPHKHPKGLPSIATIHREYAVYPGQPLVSAACIVATFGSPEEAALPSLDKQGKEHGWCEAEGFGEIPGAGGQATMAVEALLSFRKHGSIDRVIEDLHTMWRRTISSDNEICYDQGMTKAHAMEPMLRETLVRWFAKGAK